MVNDMFSKLRRIATQNECLFLNMPTGRGNANIVLFKMTGVSKVMTESDRQ